MKLRYSKSIDPEWIVERVSSLAERNDVALRIQREAPPPAIPADHPLASLVSDVAKTPPAVVGFGADASELSRAAPGVVFGPSTIANAHTPDESIEVAALERAVPLFSTLIARCPELGGST